MGTGINVSKGNILSALRPSKGVGVSKGYVLAILSPAILGRGVNISKARMYAVLKPGPAGDFWPVILRMLDQQRS